jgi:hypothetical protein
VAKAGLNKGHETIAVADISRLISDVCHTLEIAGVETGKTWARMNQEITLSALASQGYSKLASQGYSFSYYTT